MTTFVSRFKGANSHKRNARWMTALGMVAALSVTAGHAYAQTTGTTLTNGFGVLAEFGLSPLLNNDGTPTTNPTVVDLRPATYAYITNNYIGFVQGLSGSFSVNYGNSVSVTYNVPGRFAVGNKQGSLRSDLDNSKALVGFSDFAQDVNGQSYLVWPLASDGINATIAYYDYPGYVTAVVDGTVKNLGFAAADIVRGPLFVDNRLETTYDAGNNVQVTQIVRLYRATARFEYVVRNLDAAPHTVRLRQVINVHDSIDFRDITSRKGDFRSNGVFYVDPRSGRTSAAQVYTGGNIPNQLDVLQYRVLPNQGAAQVASTEYGFHARYILRGFGATLPDTVAVTDSGIYFPQAAFVEAVDAAASRAKFYDGLAVGLYWNLGGVASGASRTIVSYYGEGSSTEDLSTQDYITATEAVESIGYNTEAAQSAAFQTSPREDISKSALFYSPSQFTVYGSLYNRSINSAQQGVTLSNVSMALTLPVGLTFGPTSDQTNAPLDVASKFVGNVAPDSDAVRQWVVRANGLGYGALNYQLTTSIPNIGTKTITRTINIPAAPLRSVSNAGFQMISFPFEFNPTLSNNGDPYTVVNGISRPIDDQTDFYRYDSSLNPPRYVIVSKLETGVGYYYKPALNRVIVGKGLIPIDGQAPVAGQEVPFQTTLNRGWNMIGNPYVYSVPLNNLQFITADNLQRPLSFQEAVNAQLVRGGVFFRNQSLTGYDFIADFTSPIVPWEGYYIYANTDLILKVGTPTQVNTFVTGPRPSEADQPVKNTGGATRVAQAGAISTHRALITNPTVDNWKLQLVARRQDGREDTATFIGMSSNAKDGDDLRDLPKPTPPPSDYVYVGVTRANAGTAFMQDMRAPGGGQKTWDFEFTSDKDGPVTLQWPNMNQLPRRLRLRFTNPTTHRATDLRSASSISLDAKAGVPVRFQITATRAASQPLAITGLRPIRTIGTSGTRAAGSNYQFAFNVNQEAETTLRILTQSGREVARPFVGRAAGKGETRAIWDGKALSGQAVPVGQYQVEVTARLSEDGTLVRSKMPFMMIR